MSELGVLCQFCSQTKVLMSRHVFDSGNKAGVSYLAVSLFDDSQLMATCGTELHCWTWKFGRMTKRILKNLQSTVTSLLEVSFSFSSFFFFFFCLFPNN